jgi:hypothetical protein
MRRLSQACARTLACTALVCGGSFVLMGAPAWSLTTFNLTFASDTPGDSLSGSFTIDETDPAASQNYLSYTSPPFVANIL